MLRSILSVMIASSMLVLLYDTTDAAVRRRITIKTDPPGALVYIDDQEIGVTPVSTSFTYYGTRKIQIVKDGYETVTVLREIKPPWYQIPGIDFVTENLIRREFRDERLIQFKLVPLKIRTTNELIQRGLELNNEPDKGWHLLAFSLVPYDKITRLSPQILQIISMGVDCRRSR